MPASPHPLGLLFTGAPAIPEMVRLARHAEDRGFDSIWIAETRMTRDAFVPAAAIAQATERVRIGTGIVNVYTRNPVVLAISFLGLAELAPGRILAGLGTGSPNVLAPQGIPFERPLTRLREYCDVLRPLMRGEEVRYDGTAVHLDGARIEDVLADDTGLRAELPLWLAATGPRAMRYAGAAADGVLMNVCLPVAYVKRNMELLAAGARDAGRDPSEVEVAMAVLCCPDHDAARGRETARRFIALYLGAMPNIARETGLPTDVIDTVGATLGADGLDAATALVPDEAIDLLAAAGSPEHCRRRLDEYREAGLDHVVLTPLEGAIETTIDLLAPAT